MLQDIQKISSKLENTKDSNSEKFIDFMEESDQKNFN